jgi:hypothetical protein
MNHWNDTYNLKGFIVGNGYTDPLSDTNPRFPELLVNVNMMSPQLYQKIVDLGCVYYWDNYHDGPMHKNAPECAGYWDTIQDMLVNINLYDLFRTNYDGDVMTFKNENDRYKETIINGETRKYKRGHTVMERTPWLKQHVREDHPSYRTILGDGQSDYLNRADVRKALHIPDFIVSYE